MNQKLWFHYHRAISHPGKRRYAEALAAQSGVTVERFIEVVEAKKKAKLFRVWRRRSRRRQLDVNRWASFRGRMLPDDQADVAEGEFDVLLRMAGMNTNSFGELAGIRGATVRGWIGHPMALWPTELLKSILWARAMAEQLDARGIDPNKFKPVVNMEPIIRNSHPRTEEDVRKILEGLR